MEATTFDSLRRIAETRFGRIAYIERGVGPAALFLHGAFLNGFQWRDIVEELADCRRCIAIDLMGHGHTEPTSGQDLSFTSQAKMVDSFLDAIGVETIDLIGNDSGGGIAQIFATTYRDRVRTMMLSNCDVHDNWPPTAFSQVMAIAEAGGLFDVGREMLRNLDLARSDLGLGAGYQNPKGITDDILRAYLEPLFSSRDRARELERYFQAFDCRQTTAIEGQLKRLDAPTLIMWGTADVFFDLEWAYWLQRTIPGALEVVEVADGRLFFPEEHSRSVANGLRKLWSTAPR